MSSDGRGQLFVDLRDFFRFTAGWLVVSGMLPVYARSGILKLPAACN